jgi:class 3 adenylate cyclase
VAARLAALARTDEILVGAATRDRLGAEFSFVALGERALRNVEAPERVSRLTLPEAAPAVTA